MRWRPDRWEPSCGWRRAGWPIRPPPRAGHADLVAPPMFAVVYCSRSIAPAIFDPDVGLNFAMMVHGSQEFRWGPVVVAGDEIATFTTVKEIAERGGLGFYVFETVSENE